MKSTQFVILLIVSLVLSSCAKDDVLNAEADIISIVVPAEILKAEPVIENNRITVRVKSDTDLSQQSPEFTLSDGATISPKSGTTLNFTQPQLYKVTSQDEKVSKEYTVSYIKSEITSRFGFNHFRLDETGKYHIFFEQNESGDNIMDWASGNGAFALTANDAPADKYPTTYADVSENNFAAKLVTRRTGSMGVMFKKPIAAGNIFMGTFDVGAALSNPLAAVKMGVPYEHVPKFLKGTFKYSQGDVFVQVVENAQGEIVIEEFENGEMTDYWDIYAIFYDNSGGTLMLDGTNRFIHENLVAVAHLDQQDAIETDSWAEFEIPFIPKVGKTIDPQKLANGGYNISVVMTSSVGGDFFKGAVNSTLLIDNLEIVYTE